MSVETSTAVPAQEQSFDDTKAGWSSRWRMEFDAARKEHKDWQDKGQEIVDRFLDKRSGSKSTTGGIETRWNIYTSGVQTKMAALYGKMPQVDVRAKFSDAPDSVARIAGETLERILNGDIEDPTDGYRDGLWHCLLDRLNPGIGMQRHRYCYEERDGEETEYVDSDYVHWRDVLWSPCRTFQEMRWCAFAADLSRDEVKKKFGDEVARKIAYATAKQEGYTDSKQQDPWQRVRVWNIEDKERKCWWFFCEAYQEMLVPSDLAPGDEDDESQPIEGKAKDNGSIDDPLGLDGFWSFQRPLIANLTTSAFLPRADYTLNQDILEEIDRVSTRITDLERAIGARGVYDKESPELGRLLQESTNNQMLPATNWGALAEKGGLNKSFEMLDLTGLVAALDRLVAYRQELVAMYMQSSGDSDLTRGQQLENGTPGEAQIKARFASVRMQSLQDEFSRFASDGQRIRAEIIAKHCDAEWIIERSNIQHSYDAPQPDQMQDPTQAQDAVKMQRDLQAAVELIKSDVSCYRIEVKPESLAMADYDAIKSQRTEVVAAMGEFIQNFAPLLQVMPTLGPYLGDVLSWIVSGLPGGATISGVFDRMKAHAQQMQAQAAANPQAQQPDPKLLANQQKAQADLAKIQAQHQAEMERMIAETQQLAQRKATDAAMDVKEEAAKQAIKAHFAPPPIPGAPA